MSLSLKLGDTRVYAPQIRARLGTTAHFCEVIVLGGYPRIDEKFGSPSLLVESCDVQRCPSAVLPRCHVRLSRPPWHI